MCCSCRRELAGDGLELPDGVFEGRAGHEASEDIEPSTAALHGGKVEPQRHPELFVDGKAESSGHHPDHSGRCAVGPDDLPDHMRRAAELVLPDRVTQDDDLRAARLLVLLREYPSEGGRNAKQPE